MGWLDLERPVIVSLNEIVSASYLAARGSGHSWGASEDIAQAARWLAGHDLQWAATLVKLLQTTKDRAKPVLRSNLITPSVEANPTLAPLCPLLTGLLVSDMFHSDTGMTIAAVVEPLWLLPFAARHVRPETNLLVEWTTGSALLTITGVLLSQRPRDMPRLTPLTIRSASCCTNPESASRADEQTQFRLEPSTFTATITNAEWSALSTLATRTYVPASAMSRTSGAGAGEVDND